MAFFVGILQKNTGRRGDGLDGDSSPARHLSPPSSPSRSTSSGEITVDFQNESFDSTFTRRCACVDLFCQHRYKGTLDNMQLMQFLDMTRQQSSEVDLIKRFLLLVFFTFTVVVLDFLGNFILNK